MFCICAFRLFSFKTGWFSLIGIICCSFMLNQRISYIYTYLFQQLYSLACIYSDFYFLQSLWSENGEQQISYSVDDCWIFFFFFAFFLLIIPTPKAILVWMWKRNGYNTKMLLTSEYGIPTSHCWLPEGQPYIRRNRRPASSSHLSAVMISSSLWSPRAKSSNLDRSWGYFKVLEALRAPGGCQQIPGVK